MGGRGPLAGALFAVPLSLLGLVLRQREPVLGLLRLVILIGVLSIPLTLMMTTEGGSDPDSQFRTLNRYELQISNEDTSSMDERGQARGLALELWLEKPLFGWGLGEFRIFDSYLNYPHNLPLEVLMEMGLLGGILFAVPMLAAGIACIRTLANPYGAFADTALALLCLVELMLHVTVQGYLADDRIFFAYLAFVLERSPPPSFARGAV
jgi:O-antigen ligase